MDLNGVISVLVTGIVIGLLGRLVVPGRNSIGLVLTILVGIVGAAVGLWVGAQMGLQQLLTFVVQVVAAAVLVALISGGRRTRRRY